MRFEEILVLCTAITGLICLVHFLWQKRNKKTFSDVKPNWVVEYSRSFFPVFLIVLVLRSFIIEPFRVPTGSMKPTLVEGDFILVNKYAYGIRIPVLGTKIMALGEPKTGDVVVFKHESGKDFIKRVIGVPGDHIQYTNKELFINGMQVPTEYLQPAKDDTVPVLESIERLPNVVHNIYINPQHSVSSYPFKDFVVPNGCYFVMGDNRDNSRDGRYFGPICDKELLGKAFATWMSWDGNANDVRWSRIGKSIYKQPADKDTGEKS